MQNFELKLRLPLVDLASVSDVGDSAPPTSHLRDFLHYTLNASIYFLKVSLSSYSTKDTKNQIVLKNIISTVSFSARVPSSIGSPDIVTWFESSLRNH